MNTHYLKYLVVFALVITGTVFLSTVQAAPQTGQMKAESGPAVEIPKPPDQMRLEKPPEITQPEEKPLLPEIPKEIDRETLGPAEQVKLDQIEREQATGEITETEKDLEKDALFREANITF